MCVCVCPLGVCVHVYEIVFANIVLRLVIVAVLLIGDRIKIQISVDSLQISF